MYHVGSMIVNRWASARARITLRSLPRPRRGTPEETRQRLVASAARLFNRVGYHATDSNEIAKEAGYATGTFYKHFEDKRAIFIAAYERWVSSEWQAVSDQLSSESSPEAIAKQ